MSSGSPRCLVANHSINPTSEPASKYGPAFSSIGVAGFNMRMTTSSFVVPEVLNLLWKFRLQDNCTQTPTIYTETKWLTILSYNRSRALISHNCSFTLSVG